MATVPISGGEPVAVGGRMVLRPGVTMTGHVRVDAGDGPGVLGEEAVKATMPEGFGEVWQHADAPLELVVEVAPPAPGVLGDDPQADAMLSYAADDADAVYVAMQEIHTADGKVFYDFTRPLAGDAGGPGVLGDEGGLLLQFPIHALAPSEEPEAGAPGVLGVGEVVGGLAGDLVARRVIQLIKAPVERSLLAAIRAYEPAPHVVLPLDENRPLAGADAWRARFAPGRDHKVLLLIHGFTSSIEQTYQRRLDWVHELAPGYDAVLGYTHPTIACDVETNARDLLALIPEDVRLRVDLLCHSRGGLVGRSLVELFPDDRLRVERAAFCGSPHAGTTLADPDRWDQFVGLVTNAATLAASLAGGGAVAILPKVLGWVLRAAAQFTTDLPGVTPMRPEGPFLAQLNMRGAAEQAAQTRYAVAVSRYSIFNPGRHTFAQALQALAARAFIEQANDIVVPTESMRAIDLPTPLVPDERVFSAGVTHFGYFDDPGVRAFVAEQLRG